jgi:hypothetical protein
MRFILALILMIVFTLYDAVGQDTLPRFSAISKSNGKVIISWRNNYPAVSQISIQRSYDSSRNFTTLLTVPDPSIPENGFVDSKAPAPKMFYRLFILLGRSKYIFTKSIRAIPEAIRAIPETTVVIPQRTSPEEDVALPKIDNQRIYYLEDNATKEKPTVSSPSKINEPPKVEVEKIIFIKGKDSSLTPLPAKMLLLFRDSILNKTKDTILFVHADTILIKPFVAKEAKENKPSPEPKEVYKVSQLVFTSKSGSVTLSLPDAARKKYTAKFFELDGTPLMEVKEIKYPMLIIDKAAFIHAGWFRFELYEDGKLREKNRLLIPKEF